MTKVRENRKWDHTIISKTINLKYFFVHFAFVRDFIDYFYLAKKATKVGIKIPNVLH